MGRLKAVSDKMSTGSDRVSAILKGKGPTGTQIGGKGRTKSSVRE